MRKIILFIIVIIVLLAIGCLYLQLTNKDGGLLNLNFRKNPVRSQSNQNKEDEEPKFINQGPSPELAGLTNWQNSEPITLASLQGKVVLVNFWAYSNINCIRTLPYISKWYEQYKDKGLAVVGVHTPKFTFEKIPSNVETAVKRYKINYPTSLDNSYKTWNKYGNQFWPAIYLIDKNGDIVYTHFGEGDYTQTEKAIRKLLGLEGEFSSPPADTSKQSNGSEIYLGTIRLKNFGGTEKISDQEQIYTFPSSLAKNKFALEGKWQFTEEAAVHTSGFGRIRLNFNSGTVSMVAQSAEPTTLKIYVDGKLQKGVTISSSDLYPLYQSDTAGDHTMEIEFPTDNIQVFTFTF